MKSIYVVGGIIIVLVIGYFAFFASSNVSYTATLDNEVTALEAELVEFEGRLTAGNLTDDQAVVAQQKISTRLTTIQTAMESKNDSSLSTKEQESFLANLDKFKTLLSTFKTTLATVDLKATRSGKSNSRTKSLTEQAVETIVATEVAADAVIEDFEVTEEAQIEESLLVEEDIEGVNEILDEDSNELIEDELTSSTTETGVTTEDQLLEGDIDAEVSISAENEI